MFRRYDFMIYFYAAKNKLEILFAPPYSPMMNPVEFANMSFKRKLNENQKIVQ